MPSAEGLRIVTDLLEEHGPRDQMPTRLCETCASTLGLAGAGLCLTSKNGPTEPAAAANELSAELEELQFSLGEGPCLDAIRGGRPVLVSDLSVTGLTRWPHYARAALDAGASGVFAFPLQIGSIRLGTLDLYAENSGGLDRAGLSTALAFAEAATTVFLHLQDQVPLEPAAYPRLWVGSSTRLVVHQATGMVSVQAAVALPDALLLLRARAFATDRPLHELAKDVVDRSVRFSPEPDLHGGNGAAPHHP